MSRFRIESPAAAAALVGRELAASDWVTITQAQVDAFADVTGDRQWIHVDPDRAARESPFGATIAHGFLSLSLTGGLFGTCIAVGGIAQAINLGLDRVRFIAPVRVGSRVRARFLLDGLEPAPGGARTRWRITVDIEGAEKPACVAEMLILWQEKSAPA